VGTKLDRHFKVDNFTCSDSNGSSKKVKNARATSLDSSDFQKTDSDV
jgi:hypothetical protein